MSSREEAFGGTETPPPRLALDLAMLNDYLRAQASEIGPILTAEKFRGGQSNPTYLLTSPNRRWVLRRKPPGELLRSAHDIHREYRIMRALHETNVPVPKAAHYCSDPQIIGSEFFVGEFVQGTVFWDADLPGLRPDERTRVYERMSDILATIHDLDPAKLGLTGLAPPGDYLARNFRRWSDIYQRSALVSIPDMDWLLAELPRHFPAVRASTLIHGDFGLYNIIYEGPPWTPQAVLDWEMATVGEPLVDLAHHLRAWWDLPDPNGSTSTLSGLDFEELGIPTMDAYVRRYCQLRCIEVPELDFYIAYAQFRYAAMMQGILKRAEIGTASAKAVLHRQSRVFDVAKLARKNLS